MDAVPIVQVVDPPNPKLVRSLVAQLEGYNHQRAPALDSVDLLLVAGIPGTKNLVGGLLGFTYGDWLFVDVLWVHESMRGKGVGAMLMRGGEDAAKARGCIGAHTDTFDFQAPGFYRRLGYTVFGELGPFTGGQKRYYLRKRFDDPGEPSTDP
jgi:GNAT superfamily N-acetyltransferase